MELIINIIPAICITFMIQLVMHEVGHMLGGWITGWRLIYLQIFKIAIMKENRTLKIKLVSTSGLQCIMYPKSLNNDAIIYTLSGCIMNLILTVIALFIIVIQQDNITLWFYSWCLFMFGVGMLIMNAIPSTKRVCNDMACYLLLKKDSDTFQCHNVQLMIAKQLSNGFTYRDIDREQICVTKGYANNDITAYHKVLEYYYGLDTKDTELMNQTLINVDNNAPVSQGVLSIIAMELLYIDITQRLKNNDTSPMDREKYTDNTDAYVEQYMIKGDVHSIRVEAAYKAYKHLSKGDKKKALESIEQGIDKINSLCTIYPGDAVFCIRQLNTFIGYLGEEYSIECLIKSCKALNIF